MHYSPVIVCPFAIVRLWRTNCGVFRFRFFEVEERWMVEERLSRKGSTLLRLNDRRWRWLLSGTWFWGYDNLINLAMKGLKTLKETIKLSWFPKRVVFSKGNPNQISVYENVIIPINLVYNNIFFGSFLTQKWFQNIIFSGEAMFLSSVCSLFLSFLEIKSNELN